MTDDNDIAGIKQRLHDAGMFLTQAGHSLIGGHGPHTKDGVGPTDPAVVARRSEEAARLFSPLNSVGPTSTPEEVRAYILSKVRMGEVSWIVPEPDQALLRALDSYFVQMSVTDLAWIAARIQ